MSLGHNDFEQLCSYCVLIIKKHHIYNVRMRLIVTILFDLNIALRYFLGFE